MKSDFAPDGRVNMDIRGMEGNSVLWFAVKRLREVGRCEEADELVRQSRRKDITNGGVLIQIQKYVYFWDERDEEKELGREPTEAEDYKAEQKNTILQ